MNDTNDYDLANLKQSYISWAKNQVDNGSSHVNPEELKIITDSIKDIAEAEKYCYEAKYYKSVVKAMEEGSEDSEYSYYRPSYRMGYRPGIYDAMYRGPMPTNDTTAPYFNNEWRMDEDADQYLHGKAYSNYRKALRHYTETHSDHDKEIMNANANSHMSGALSTIREIWAEADPVLRQKMKTSIANLMGEMNS